jgi:hypothetical protein
MQLLDTIHSQDGVPLIRQFMDSLGNGEAKNVGSGRTNAISMLELYIADGFRRPIQPGGCVMFDHSHSVAQARKSSGKRPSKRRILIMHHSLAASASSSPAELDFWAGTFRSPARLRA